MECPLCSSDSTLAFEVNGYNVLDCTVCTHRFAEIETNELHTVSTYDDSYFTGGGAGYTDYLDESTLLRKRGKMYANKIENFITNKRRVLDVGAAAGCVLQGFIDSGWQGTGIEPNESMATYGRNEFGLDIKQGAFENFESDENFDLISMIQVVPHFHNQRKAFEKAAALLNEGGVLLIETWNRNSVTAKIFGKKWHEYSPPSVLQWYSLEGLTNFVESFGFDRVANGRPSKTISSSHAKSLLKYRMGNSPLLKLIPDKVNLPYPSEDLFWALFRKK